MSPSPPFICEERNGERTRAVARRECVVPGQRWSWWIFMRISVDREWVEWIPAIAKCIFFREWNLGPRMCLDPLSTWIGPEFPSKAFKRFTPAF
jgi:hypothetical protein